MKIDNEKLKNKTKKNLAEESFKISISDFGKKLLYPANIKGMDDFDYLLSKKAGTLKGREGSFDIKNGSNSLLVSYRVDLNRSPKALEIWFSKKDNSLDGGTNQNIELKEDIAMFGIRYFFLCSCGRKTTVLYLPDGEYFFKCRECANIIYESQTINKHTMNGLFWHTHQMIKLANRRERIKRMFYGGGLSKKGQKFTDLYNEWDSEVKKEAMMKAGEF